MTDRPTIAPRGLEDVIRAHSTVATGLGEWCCRCTPSEWRPTAYRSAHVAAAVREWLTSEAVVRPVEDALVAGMIAEYGEDDATWRELRSARRIARAALAAAAGVV